MRAIVKTSAEYGAKYVEDYPEPTVGPNDVLIEVGAVSVCGTDREMYEWTPAAQAFNPVFPVVLGHEFAGTVIEVGHNVKTVVVGDRVACETHIPCGHCFLCRSGNAHNCFNMKVVAMQVDGAFAERVVMPESVCFNLPESLTIEVGALLEPAGVAWHAVQRSSKAVAAGTVLISGCGPVGLFLMQFAFHLGAAEVVAIEPNPYRQDLARSLGATVFAPEEDVVGYVLDRFPQQWGVDVAFEVSGAGGALQTLLDAVRREGQIVTIGHPSLPIPVDIARYINKKGITLKGVFGRRIWDTWQDLTQVLASGNVDLSWMISHRLPMGELGAVIDLLKGDANKVLLLPHGPEGSTR